MVFIVSDHLPVVEQCEGCKKVLDGHCVAYINPAGKWKNRRCPLCSLRVEETGFGQTRKRVGQQKQTKRGGGSKPYMYRRGKYEKSDSDRVAPKVRVK